MEEIWKDIKDYEGFYQVSNLGRVKRLSRKLISDNKKQNRTLGEKILRPDIATKYASVILTKDNVRKSFLIHVLVWCAFNGEIPKGLTIDHIDNNKFNNLLDNLQLLDNRDNIIKGKRLREKSSRFIGVSYSKDKGKWESAIRQNNKRYRLGYYSCETLAALNYEKKAIQLYGKCSTQSTA